MNHTNIEWIVNPDGSRPGWSWNPLSGCRNHTPEGLCLDGLFPCYAFKLANTRLKPLYLANEDYAPVDVSNINMSDPADDPFYPRFWEERLGELPRYDEPALIRGSRGIFVCDMSDLFGIGVPTEWTRQVLRAIEDDPYDRFYLLTKQAQNLIKFSPFPENCWVGVTATNDDIFQEGLWQLQRIQATKVFISLEPFLAPIKDKLLWRSRLDWLIIGAWTGTVADIKHISFTNGLTLKQWGKKWTAQPRIEWVREIVEAADKAGVKVFLKDNLKPLFAPNYEVMYPWAYKWGQYRQEMPIE